MINILNIKYKELLDKYLINTPLRLSHFFAQIEHESGLKPREENLNYSADRLLVVFPKYFDENNVYDYARKPIMIASRVYKNRMGNGSEASGDGWKYRGRGFIQLTGKDNYTEFSKATGINCVNDPDLLLKEENAMLSALWFWNKRNLSILADKDDLKNITRRINGGYNGLEHRKELLNLYKEIFI